MTGSKRRQRVSESHPVEMLLGELQSHEGPKPLVKGLTKDWVQAILVLLQNQSVSAVAKFSADLKAMNQMGYGLTSLVAELRCAFRKKGGAPIQIWSCKVRPKIGAKSRFDDDHSEAEMFSTNGCAAVERVGGVFTVARKKELSSAATFLTRGAREQMALSRVKDLEKAFRKLRPQIAPWRTTERRTILKVLSIVKGDKALAAALVGISKTSMWRKLCQYQRERLPSPGKGSRQKGT